MLMRKFYIVILVVAMALSVVSCKSTDPVEESSSSSSSETSSEESSSKETSSQQSSSEQSSSEESSSEESSSEESSSQEASSEEPSSKKEEPAPQSSAPVEPAPEPASSAAPVQAQQQSSVAPPVQQQQPAPGEPIVLRTALKPANAYEILFENGTMMLTSNDSLDSLRNFYKNAASNIGAEGNFDTQGLGLDSEGWIWMGTFEGGTRELSIIVAPSDETSNYAFAIMVSYT